ncbi:unnamed protein product [Symbiodinium sp. CCMP2592]|nr:unnamed protein product [Symbiodinium sp. CCMP2592]
MKNILSVQAVGSGRGSFILEMGGIRILVNPNLQGSDLKPENVHEEFDYVFLSSEEPEFFHRPTVDKMKLTKVKFVTSQKAGQELAKMMVRNLAVLQNGPGGQCYLQKKDKAAAAVGVLSAPGSGSFPWEKQEQGFIFVNLETGAAVAYEAFGQFLSKGASSNKPDIPEEAYQVDFLITPNLAEAAGVAAGLTQKGAKLRGVLRLPGEGPIQEEESPMAALDKAFGGIDDDPDQFRNFLKDQGKPLAETRLLMAEANGAPELAAVATQLPDIRWLGRQILMWCGKPQEDLWNDFAVLHQNQTTDLEIPGHRGYFGEKALRFGGVDIILRTLALFQADERVGNHGILDIFSEPLHGRFRSILHFAPRTDFFLRPENFRRYILPRLDRDRTLTPQQIANTMLVMVAPPQTPLKLQAFKLVTQRFGACLAASVADMAMCLCCTSTGWEEVFCNADIRGAARVLWHLCEDTAAPPFPPAARGSRSYAEMLLEAQHLQLARILDDFELELEGQDAQDPLLDEDYSFTSLVQRCVARHAFENEGLQLLCEAVGLSFTGLPEGAEEEALKQASAEGQRAITALGLTCTHLAEGKLSVVSKDEPGNACLKGCGRLSAHDLNVMAQTFWPELTADELRDLYQTVCRNRSGYVELHEFCAALGFDPRASPASQETARSLSQLDGALQVVLDRIRISILEAPSTVAGVLLRVKPTEAIHSLSHYVSVSQRPQWHSARQLENVSIAFAREPWSSSCWIVRVKSVAFCGMQRATPMNEPWLFFAQLALPSLAWILSEHRYYASGGLDRQLWGPDCQTGTSDVDGSVVTWGDREWGGDSSKVQRQLVKGAVQVFGTYGAFDMDSAAENEDLDQENPVTETKRAFAATKARRTVCMESYIFSLVMLFHPAATALLAARPMALASALEQQTALAVAAERAFLLGSVVTWGDGDVGGDSSAVASQLRKGVRHICASYGAFAAVKEDGSVVTWGHPDFGGLSSEVSGRIKGEVVLVRATRSAFAALKADGSVVTWGDPSTGGDPGEVEGRLRSGVKQLVATYGAFAVVTSDGAVVSWGSEDSGGRQLDSSGKLRQGVRDVCSNFGAFAAIKEDGTVVAWGEATCGGDTFPVHSDLRNVQQVCGTYSAFAALKQNGTVVAWGDADWGGDTSQVQEELKGVTQVCSTYGAFAALRNDGSVIAWGDMACGGDASAVASRIRKRVFHICSTYGAFAATKTDGSVVTWGDADWGGNSSTVQDQLYMISCVSGTFRAFLDLRASGTFFLGDDAFDSSDASYDGLLVGVARISGTGGAFAATKVDGSVVTWGDPKCGGDSSKVKQQLRGVVEVSHTAAAFAARMADGSVLAWGDPACGGQSTSTQKLRMGARRVFGLYKLFACIREDGTVSMWGDETLCTDGTGLKDIVSVAGTAKACAALTADGSVLAWGEERWGGDCSKVSSQLQDVQQICATGGAFAARTQSGAVVTWGDAASGGDSLEVWDQLSDGVVDLSHTSSAFAARKADGSVVTWGNEDLGGNSFELSYDLSSDVAQVYGNGAAFAALKVDGSVVCWGDASAGANFTLEGVMQICGTYRAFAAVKANGSVVAWGDPDCGGDCSKVAAALRGDVVQLCGTFGAFAAVKKDGTVAAIDAGNLFQKLDVAGNGYLRHDEVSLMAYAFDPQLTGQQLDALFRHFDPRGCGMVDLEGRAGKDLELRPNHSPSTDAHGRFYDVAFSTASINLESFDAQGLANLAWAAAVLSGSSRTRPLLAGIGSAAGAVARRAVTVSHVSEARTLAFSLLALTWALSFSKELDSELERDIVQAVRQLAGVLDTGVEVLTGLTPQSPGLTFHGVDKPRVIIDSPGMLVALKPPGWEVDTTTDQTEAHCLSAHLQAIRRREDCPLLHCASYGFGFIHRLDVASSGLVLAATTFQGLLWLQFQKAVNRIDREYIVLCYGLDPQPEHVIDADVTVRGWLKASRTLTEDAGLPAESRLRSVAHLQHPAFGRLSAISIQIFTGRRHQIRAHTRWMRHPTVCDAWYSPSDVCLVERDMLGPAPMRAWVHTPRWDGELTAPPEEMRSRCTWPELA